MLQMESEQGQTEQRGYGDILRPNHSTKGHQYVQYIHVQKKLFYTQVWKKNHTSLTNGKIKETIQATVLN